MLGWFSAFSGEDRFEPGMGALDRDGLAGGDAGLVVGTRIATATGWRPVEAIAAGDRVLTFDAGLQTVTRVERLRLWSEDDPCPQQFWPMEVPAGALGNRERMLILPGQNIMLESDTAEDLYGDPFSLIPAGAMEGVRGIDRVPPEQDVEIVLLHFPEEQVVFAENGALFLCPASLDMIECAREESARPFYSVLSMDEARFLAVRMEDEIAMTCSHSPREAMAAVAVA